jgi:hypothetical protein
MSQISSLFFFFIELEQPVESPGEKHQVNLNHSKITSAATITPRRVSFLSGMWNS